MRIRNQFFTVNGSTFLKIFNPQPWSIDLIPTHINLIWPRKCWIFSNAVLRIPNVYPGSWFLPIPDPGSRIQKQEQKRGVKINLLSYTFFCSHKLHKKINYFIFEMLKKKIGANFQRIITFYPKNIFRIPDPGVKKAPDPGSGSATLQQCPLIWTVRHSLALFPPTHPPVYDWRPRPGSR